ncbi:hypothetical protein JCM8097_006882 [Rhodosporidiobolus ruineniae]
MATPAAPAGAGAAAAVPAEGGGGFFANPLIRQAIQGFVIFQVVQLVFKGKIGTPAPASLDPRPAKTLLDVSLKLSPEEDPLNVDLKDESYPGVTWEGLEWSNSGWERVWETEWDVPESVQHNGSFYLDVFVTRAGQSPVPSDPKYPADGEVLHVRKSLTRYLPERRVVIVKNLLSGSKDDDEAKKQDEEKEAEEQALWAKKEKKIVSYYHPNVTLQLVTDSGNIPYNGQPEPVKRHIIPVLNADGNPKKTHNGMTAYYPPVFPNDFWLRSGAFVPINSTTTRLPLRVEFTPQSHFKFQLLSTMDDAFTKQSQATGGGGGELDEVKRMLTETNPLLLITTAVVSVLHMLFEFLAFTADVKHWRGKKELVGVSVRTILTNVFVQTVVLLYLVDQSEETSWMILFSSGMGVLIEAWKITKAVDMSIIPHPSRPLLPYKLSIKDKHVLSEDELKTQAADREAFRYVAWAATPLLIGWTIYSLYYQAHKSWYSFVIQTLTSFVQAFGFVQLIPQLLINYKLKSVAVHDFFSFIIKMPLLHRLACFRDDVVFLILLYQMWIYKVDPSRENEYGQKLTDEEAKALLEQQARKAQSEKGVKDVKGKGKGTAEEESKKDK